ncbi:conserved protein of unknown function [Rhodovastum atsumiense]|uniref:Flagellar assembly regulator FliX n=1 Tax=Rhodovastum atsumiense TaxID=504468 RepID=A0A5M6J2A1_9PROT|nr:flagellar assembly protein FliX [Rhodovastum atsumiense]KAA5614743.1 hypothetical protein F1189_01045 [Rhodovastum atsumiense]CAH2599713.1 conserved protein of unknown function [Rhodovastum atsumiense]
MVSIEGIGTAAPVRPAARSSSRREGFRIAGGLAEPAADLGGTAGIALETMLALQEAEGAASRDRQARRHAQDILAELAALQRGLLGAGQGGGPDPGALRRLAALAGQVPLAADPALRDIVAAVTLRARVELARRHANVISA